MVSEFWNQCLSKLERDIPASEFNIWIKPLQAEEQSNNLVLYAPNKFVVDFVRRKFLGSISEYAGSISGGKVSDIELKVGSLKESIQKNSINIHKVENDSVHLSKTDDIDSAVINNSGSTSLHSVSHSGKKKVSKSSYRSRLNKHMTFENFVEGQCNMIARAAALQIVETIGSRSNKSDYNPFLVYGGVGLGKTHLIHALGNTIIDKWPDAKVIYLHSERFVQEMITALQNKTIDQFKNFYRSVDVLLIDDIQFFAKKERSQEEFFHTFNALLEGQKQIIMTCDTFPKEVTGIDDRLKSRFGWGLSVGIELPDIETRVAILISKAKQLGVELPQDVAFFIAQRIKSNIRELEGALKKVIATSRFQGRDISVDFVKQALHDLIVLQDKQVSIENIKKTVAEYYNLRINDLNSKRRNRSLSRPRQMAMFLSKELTNHSLPEIGDAFGGRDHTTVLHACKKINELKQQDTVIVEDYNNLYRILTS